jgi:hypothetical protein
VARQPTCGTIAVINGNPHAIAIAQPTKIVEIAEARCCSGTKTATVPAANGVNAPPNVSIARRMLKSVQ